MTAFVVLDKAMAALGHRDDVRAKASDAGEVFLIDSMPVPVCHWARARRCRKVRGRAFCGKCAAKGERFFGWRLHGDLTVLRVVVVEGAKKEVGRCVGRPTLPIGATAPDGKATRRCALPRS